jgi:hypothetical protein
VGSNLTASSSFCLCVYGYPYVSSELTKPFVIVPEARSKCSNALSAQLGKCVAVDKFI